MDDKLTDLPKKSSFTPAEVAIFFNVSLMTIYRELETFEITQGAEGLCFFRVRGVKRIPRESILAYAAKSPWNKPKPATLPSKPATVIDGQLPLPFPEPGTPNTKP